MINSIGEKNKNAPTHILEGRILLFALQAKQASNAIHSDSQTTIDSTGWRNRDVDEAFR